MFGRFLVKKNDPSSEMIITILLQAVNQDLKNFDGHFPQKFIFPVPFEQEHNESD